MRAVRLGTALVAAGILLAGCSAGLPGADQPRPAAPTTPATAAATAPATGTAATGRAPVADAGPPSQNRRFADVARLTGELTPKSVDASPKGYVVAQNMIYTHTISVFSPEHRLVRTIPDRVVPAQLGHPELDGPLRGGPVEASFAPDGKHLWVSNYSMYGPGFTREGHDLCSPSSGYDTSLLYRVDTSTWTIDGIVPVGSVPKYVLATPDGRTVLVTNWCSYSLSVVDTATLKELARIPVGRYPRGIAVTADSSTAYVAVMGGTAVKRVDVAAARAGDRSGVHSFSSPGRAPRHLNLSPDGRYLYATLNGVGTIAKIDARTGRVLDTVRTGNAPRSSVLSPDGTALFVVNYESDTVSRVRTSDLTVLESRHVDHHPIGITYNGVTHEVWVCSYIGVINVLADAGR